MSGKSRDFISHNEREHRKNWRVRYLGKTPTRLTSEQRAKIWGIGTDLYMNQNFPPMVAFYNAVDQVDYPTKKNGEYPTHIHRAAEKFVDDVVELRLSIWRNKKNSN